MSETVYSFKLIKGSLPKLLCNPKSTEVAIDPTSIYLSHLISFVYDLCQYTCLKCYFYQFFFFGKKQNKMMTLLITIFTVE